MRRFTITSFNTQPPEGGWVLKPSGVLIFKWFQHTAARRRLGWPIYIQPTHKRFQHTAARRRLVFTTTKSTAGCLFQHTAARRRLARSSSQAIGSESFQHTAARRRLAEQAVKPVFQFEVSTHSRPKAAGRMFNEPLAVFVFQHTAARRRLDMRIPTLCSTVIGFNTQPPEGGWLNYHP